MLNNSGQAAPAKPSRFLLCSGTDSGGVHRTSALEACPRPARGTVSHAAPDSMAPPGSTMVRPRLSVIAHLSEAPRPLPACVSQADIAQGGRCLQRENPARWGLGQGGRSPATAPLSFGATSFKSPRFQTCTHRDQRWPLSNVWAPREADILIITESGDYLIVTSTFCKARNSLKTRADLLLWFFKLSWSSPPKSRARYVQP